MTTSYEEELLQNYIKNLHKSMADYFTECEHKLTEIELRHFNPDQPRVPAGSSDGGQWTGGGIGGGAAGGRSSGISTPHPSSGFNATNATRHIEGNVSKREFGEGRCAQHVHDALRKGGVNVAPPPKRPGRLLPEARDYGPSLERAGFSPAASAPEGRGYPPTAGYVPAIGDVAVIQATSRNLSGHIAMYTGKNGWVSDFKQRDFWPGPTYRTEKPSYKIYRYK